ncbi:MAG: hypothetical protein U0167_14155 [bacterium]
MTGAPRGHLPTIAACTALLLAVHPASARTIHVAPDSSGDVLNVQAAIDVASNGDVIELADGLFTGPGNWDLNLGTKDLTIRSQHGATATTVDGGYPTDMWAKHQGFILHGGQTSATVLEDITVTGVATTQEGGAISCVGASPLIRHMRIVGNRYAVRGVGLFSQGGAPVVQDCVFDGLGPTESAICGRQSFLTLERCTIRNSGCSFVVDLDGGTLTDCALEHNDPYGKDPNLFMYARSGDVSLLRCRLASSFSEGIRVGPQANLFVGGCAFDSLHGLEGTAIWGNGTAVVRSTTFRALIGYYAESVIQWWRTPDSPGSISFDHCVFVRNISSGYFGRDGVVYADGAIVNVSHCTFAWNVSYDAGASAFFLWDDAQLSLDHTIIAFGDGSANGAVRCEGKSVVDARCCDIYGNAGGDWTWCIADQLGTNGNFSSDPAFCRDLPDEVSLQTNSPCAAPNAGACGLIGALGIACGPTALQERSWGSIKALYR